MDHVKSYWTRRRAAFAVGVGAVLLGGAIIVFGARLLASQIPRLAAYWQVSAESDRLYLIATLVNLGLTFCLLLATSIYAWLTRSTLNELIETRRASKRPTLITSFNGFDVTQHGDWYDFRSTLVVRNFGPGVAIGIHGSAAVVASTVADESAKARANAQVVSTFGPGVTIESGAEVAFPLHFIFHYNPAFGPHRGMAEVKLKFEDVERNLYVIEQQFDAYRHRNIVATWTLGYDALYITPNSKRSYTYDTDPNIESSNVRRFLVHERANLDL